MSESSQDLFYGDDGPTERQAEFRDSPQTYKLYGGSLGGGKSYALSAEALRFSLMYSGNKGFMCRSEAKAFKETTLDTLLNLIFMIEDRLKQKILVGHNRATETLFFITKSKILYGGLGGRENHDRVKSMELGFYCVDEASECNEEDIDMLESRLRHRLPDGSYPEFFGLYASNPEPGWLKRRFIVPHVKGILEENRKFVPALPRDNKWLPPGYIENISRGKPDYWVKRYIEGSWDAAEGQVYPMFDFDIHVYPNTKSNYEIPHPKKRSGYPSMFAAFDHGQTNPACFLGFFKDFDDNVFIYDEYYSPGLISRHCNQIKKIFNIHLFDYKRADPSIDNVSGERDGVEWTLHKEYASQGIAFTKANNDIEAGINRVCEYLSIDPEHTNPITGEKGAPYIYISARCVHLIDEIFEYQWEKSHSDKKDPRERPKKRRDHACDAMRYGLVGQPSVFKKIAEIPRGSYAYIKNEMKRNNRKVNSFKANILSKRSCVH